jgi:hypothetical protein
MGGCFSNEKKTNIDQSRIKIEVTNSTDPNKSHLQSPPVRAINEQSTIKIIVPED